MDSVRLKVLKEPAGSNCGSQNDFTNKMLKNSEEEPGEEPGKEPAEEPGNSREGNHRKEPQKGECELGLCGGMHSPQFHSIL